MNSGWLRGLCRLTLALYPEGWRVRYGPELEEVLSRNAITPFTLMDLAVSALDAHRHPGLAPSEVLSMSARQRSSLVSILVATVVFAAAWAAVLSVRDPLPAWLAAADAHPDLRLAIDAVQLGGAAAILAVLGGGFVLLGSASIRGGPASGTGRPLGDALLAFVAFLALVGVAGIGMIRPLNNAIGTGPASLLWVLALLCCILVGLVGIARAVGHAGPDQTAVRLCLFLGWFGVIAMTVAAAASLWLAVAVTLEAPDIGASILPVVSLALASGWVALALRRAGGFPSTLQVG